MSHDLIGCSESRTVDARPLYSIAAVHAGVGELKFCSVSRLLYSLPAWEVFASAADVGRIDALLKRAYKWSFSKDIVTLNELINKPGTSLFQKLHSPSHCLNPLLPSKKIISYNLRNSDNSYVLPQCKLNVFKRSFINWCLFSL